MRNKNMQMSLWDIYQDVAASLEEAKPKLFRMLDEYIDWDAIIPARFYTSFFQRIGRPREYPLEGFIKSLLLQRISDTPTTVCFSSHSTTAGRRAISAAFARIPTPPSSHGSSRIPCHTLPRYSSVWWRPRNLSAARWTRNLPIASFSIPLVSRATLPKTTLRLLSQSAKCLFFH